MTESDRARHDSRGHEAPYAVEHGAELPTTTWERDTSVIPNVPPENLVQIGIGGCQAPRQGVKVDRIIRRTIGCLVRAGHLPRRRNA
jgi:hypothetical protein